MSNPLIYSKVILPTDDTAAAPSIQMGGGIVSSSGTVAVATSSRFGITRVY